MAEYKVEVDEVKEVILIKRNGKVMITATLADVQASPSYLFALVRAVAQALTSASDMDRTLVMLGKLVPEEAECYAYFVETPDTKSAIKTRYYASDEYDKAYREFLFCRKKNECVTIFSRLDKQKPKKLIGSYVPENPLVCKEPPSLDTN